MFIKYDEYELLELFCNEPISIGTVETVESINKIGKSILKVKFKKQIGVELL